MGFVVRIRPWGTKSKLPFKSKHDIDVACHQLLAHRTARPVAASRARAVRVHAVAQPSHKKAPSKAPPSSSSGDAKAGAKAEAKPQARRSTPYNTWQAMARHASQSSATPSGFDESMM